MKKKLQLLGIISLIFIFSICLPGFIKENRTVPVKKQIDIMDNFIPLTDITEGRPNIYLIVKSMDSSYWDVVRKGAKQSSIDNECNVYIAGSRLETEWELQEAYIKRAVDSGADAIIIGPNDSVKMSNVVDEVHKKGIPIVIIDTIVNTESYDICYMTDNLLAGEHAAREMIRMLKEQGHTDNDNVTVAIELGAKNSQTINERLAGFCEYWTKHTPSTWKIIDEITCNDGDEKLAVQLSLDVLEEYPNVDGVFGTDNASTMGFSSALMKNNNEQIVLVGFDYSPEVDNIINAGNYNVSIMLQRQYDMGYRSVVSALSLLNGTPPKQKFIDTGVAVLNKYTIDSEKIVSIIQKNNRGN